MSSVTTTFRSVALNWALMKHYCDEYVSALITSGVIASPTGSEAAVLWHIVDNHKWLLVDAFPAITVLHDNDQLLSDVCVEILKYAYHNILETDMIINETVRKSFASTRAAANHIHGKIRVHAPQIEVMAMTRVYYLRETYRGGTIKVRGLKMLEAFLLGKNDGSGLMDALSRYAPITATDTDEAVTC